MSVHWTTEIMREIDSLDWGGDYPSKVQRQEMKELVIQWRQVLEHALGLCELQWRRGAQSTEEEAR